MLLADTNVLVYAANRGMPEHARCRALLDGWRAAPTPWCLTWGILYEFLRVVTHRRVFARPWTAAEGWRFVEALLASPSLHILSETSRHAALVLQTMADVPLLSGNLLHDAHTAVLMREHGIRTIYTRDTDFHRFPFLEVIDPLRA
ncbi:PIN domain-containing protein [bacterium]|nr:PIN domain-containing protein [bacterium]